MLKSINGIRLVRFEPELHTGCLYAWYYSAEYPEFYRQFPDCPSATQIAAGAQGKTFMVLNQRGEAVGTVMHFKEDEVARNFEVAILIDKNFERQGYAFTALKILLNWRFNYCNLYKAKINVVSENQRLCNAVETFGCTREGVPKKEAYFGGEYHNVAAYAIFKADFNKKYLHEFKQVGPRLDAPIQERSGYGQREASTVETVPRPAIRIAGEPS